MLSIAVGGTGINGGTGNQSGGGGGGGGGNYSSYNNTFGQDANLGTSGDSARWCFKDNDHSVGGVDGNGGDGANCRKNKSPQMNPAGGGGFFTNGGNGGGDFVYGG
jgi:hypothetical protein